MNSEESDSDLIIKNPQSKEEGGIFTGTKMCTL